MVAPHRRVLILAVLAVGICLGVPAVALAPVVAGAPPARVPEAASPAAPEPALDDGQQAAGPAPAASISWRASRAVGKPWAGRLQRGVQLPAEGADWFTWDPILLRSPDRPWRRWGTDGLIRTLLKVVREYRIANPTAPRVGVGDLSRPLGGPFGARYGGLGHSSHQNGLDVDVLYPRLDGREREASAPREVDEQLAQDLVDRFVDAGAQEIYVGSRLRLRGPRRIVSKLVHHNDHMHVRIPRPPE